MILVIYVNKYLILIHFTAKVAKSFAKNAEALRSLRSFFFARFAVYKIS